MQPAGCKVGVACSLLVSQPESIDICCQIGYESVNLHTQIQGAIRQDPKIQKSTTVLPFHPEIASG